MEESKRLNLIVKKRKAPLAHPYISNAAVMKYKGEANTRLFAYKYFDTAFSVKAGDVYLARFPLDYGAELHGDHFVAVLLDSTKANPLVTVVPLKSEKAKALNPASDIRMGIIRGINSGHRTVAVINQVKGIDKRRLLSEEAINGLHSQVQKNLIGDCEEVCAEKINKYRLTPTQLRILKKVTLCYIKSNYVEHGEEELVDF